MGKEGTIDVRVQKSVAEQMPGASRIVKLLTDVPLPVTKGAKTKIDDSVLTYLRNAIMDYVCEDKKDNDTHIVTKVKLSKHLPDTNAFDPQNPGNKARLPPQIVYVSPCLPVTHEWIDYSLAKELRANPFELNRGTSPFLVPTKPFVDKRDFGFLLN